VAEQDPPVAPLAAFHHASLSVRDLDASVRWYSDVLGFDELFREEGDDRRACVMAFAGGDYSVGLVEHRPPTAVPFDHAVIGLDHLAFSIRSEDDLAGWAARLTEAGVDHSGVIAIPPGAILNLRDPDGIALALFWDRD
jgi:catechol 2,3-dioxygenase-like lactoylglutathione lyase family enzyme